MPNKTYLDLLGRTLSVRVHTKNHYVHWTGSPCREWQGARGWANYGLVRMNGVLWRAHRLIWTFFHGPIANGIVICHHCDNPPCIEPSHLWSGTMADNINDRDRKGRGDFSGLRRHNEIRHLLN